MAGIRWFSKFADGVADRVDPSRVARRVLTERLARAVFQDSLDETLAALFDGADPNARIDGGERPLHAAVKHASLAVCEALLDAGARVDEVSGFRRRALHDALEQSSAEVDKTRLLLERGADPNSTGPHDLVPLRISIHLGASPELTRALLEYGADPNATLATGLPAGPLASAAASDKFAHAQLLVAAGASLEKAFAGEAGSNQTWSWLRSVWEEGQLRDQVGPSAPAHSRQRAIRSL